MTGDDGSRDGGVLSCPPTLTCRSVQWRPDCPAQPGLGVLLLLLAPYMDCLTIAPHPHTLHFFQALPISLP